MSCVPTVTKDFAFTEFARTCSSSLVLCAEEALDVAGRYEEVLARTPSLGKAPLVAVIKEVAPTKKAATDEILGVAAFQREYFGNR